ncbi:hypothetical protein BBK36DRAFT_1139815 [Trichoderma citrinoviride]|uniref:Uncharacterized protein n=1 Tax=Trichoderma citrinoviride TaxID=58853 RepID=A0A2T4BG79_9HYPO|nr:hypothetical protein BBK36DRAFT_1139815 [Trichoderma citrinoviride]PTB68325.1 hypothetical protein BBK36DRAFT_1139815 [Trichoderma citrinoviride]
MPTQCWGCASRRSFLCACPWLGVESTKAFGRRLEGWTASPSALHLPGLSSPKPLRFVKISSAEFAARYPCQTSELAGSAIEAMRPISMALNDLLHGKPQSILGGCLHVRINSTHTDLRSQHSRLCRYGRSPEDEQLLYWQAAADLVSLF